MFGLMMRRRREVDAKVAVIPPHNLKTVRLCCIKEALINEEQLTAESKGLEHIRGPSFGSLRRRGFRRISRAMSALWQGAYMIRCGTIAIGHRLRSLSSTVKVN